MKSILLDKRSNKARGLIKYMSNNEISNGNVTKGTVTVVTAYYCVKSKHEPSQYHAWINNLLLHVGSNCKMVIFTSSDLVEYMNAVCKKNVLGASFTVISMEMKEFKLLKRYPLKMWVQQYAMDPQKSCGRTIECYLIWNSKLMFLKEAMKRNIYDSDKYVWVDIGSCRTTTNPKLLEDFPRYENVSNDKIDIVLLRPYAEEEMKQVIFYNTVHLSGAMFGGNIRAINRLYENFYKALDVYLCGKCFAGCDQQILSTCCVHNPEIFNLIIPDSKKCDVWFYLYHHWS
jgi:hypothetical protein